jgi:hypothetical protein
MLTISEESGKITPDEIRDSPSSDTPAPSTDTDISELVTIAEISDVCRNVNSPETLPSTKKIESKASAKELQELEKANSYTGEDLTVFSSIEISECKSNTTAVCKEEDGTKSKESSFKRKQQPSDAKPNELAFSSDDLAVIKSAFERDETSHKKDDVQVCVMSVQGC